MEKKRKHILFISSWYPNRQNPTHGIFNLAFARAAALYNTVSVLHVCSDSTISSDLETEEQNENGVYSLTVYYRKVQTQIPLISVLLKRYRLIRAFGLGYRMLQAKRGRPQLIQLNVAMPAGIGARYLSKKYRIPYLLNEAWTGYCPEDGSYRGRLMKYFTRQIVAGARRLMPVSEGLKEAMLAQGLSGDYTIVPNVVETGLFLPPSTTRTGESPVQFIHISALDDRQKNVSGILRAFSQALKQDPDMILNIAGDGPQRPALEQLAIQLDLREQVRFRGKLIGPELAELLRQSDALVMFSNYETFCLTVAEALACGKPVITSRAGGLTSLITPGLGILIEKRDETALRQAFLHMKEIKHQFNPEDLRRFVTERYTPEKIGRQLTDIYDTVADQS